MRVLDRVAYVRCLGLCVDSWCSGRSLGILVLVLFLDKVQEEIWQFVSVSGLVWLVVAA